ncbi:metal-dependent hydrolase [uncultured archaeon]|nr:metal-dependent hydrolase [uncultured archaeon]
MTSTLIENAMIVTQNSLREIIRGNILIENDRISYIGNEKKEADTVLSGKNKIAMPGMINTHSHAAMGHFKGLLDDMSLEGFLEKTFKLDSERSEEGIYNSSRLSMLEMVDSGITSFVDLYYSEDMVANAAREIGIRSFLSWVTLDEEFTTQKGSPIKNAENFINSNKNDPLITPSIGVQGIYVSSDENYRKALDVSDRHGTILHTHLAETRKEVYDFVKKSGGKRPIEHLSEIGMLNERLLAAHCVWATLREVKLLAKGKAKVSWNAVSNSKLGVGGIAPVPEMLENGLTVTLGTDSNGSNNSLNPFESMKYAALSVKNERWDASKITAQTVLDMATINGAMALGRGDLGSIETGKKADLILLDSSRPNLVPTTEVNAVSNIVYSANTSNVDTVIINGRVLKHNGILSYEKMEEVRESRFN